MTQYVELSFMGVPPKEVYDLIPIVPTICHAAGEERIPGVPWKNDLWAVRSTSPESELDISVHFANLFKRLSPHFAAIKNLAKRASPTVSWVVVVSADENTPIGVISPETLRTLCELGAVLNVSLYFDRRFAES
jgi:hypothetical protein